MSHISTDNDAYEFAGWGTGDTPTGSGNTYEYHITANTTYYAFFKRKQFAVTFAPEGTYGTSTVSAAISSTGLTSGNSYNYGNRVTFTATPATGYKIEGWYSDAGCTASLSNGTNTTYTVESLTAAANVYVKFVPKQATISFTNTGTGYSTGGQSSTVTATYDQAMPTTISTPTAQTGWAFMGYFDSEGVMYYNANGTSARNWDKDTEAGVTLYAHYAKAEITSVTFGSAIVNPWTEDNHVTVTATANISPTPTGDTYVCWRLLRMNGNEISDQPDFSQSGTSGATATFPAPQTPGSYKVEATLRSGATGCNGAGEVISVTTGTFQVAGPHTITVEYKCGDDMIAPSVSMSGEPLEWTEVEAPDDIFGYTFSEWEAGDGITLQEATTARANQFKATYDGGKLTAVYTKKNIIYFKNTLGWSTVHVNLLKTMKWGYQGTGNDGASCYAANAVMNLVPGTSDIYYYEYTDISAYVSFTEGSYTDATGFYEAAGYAKVVYPTRPDATQSSGNNSYADDASFGFQSATPMFVPLATQTGQNYNHSGERDHATYYNKGYWVNYDPINNSTGYTLVVYDKQNNTDRHELQRIPLNHSDKEGTLFEVTTDLEAYSQRNSAYGIKFERGELNYTNTSSFSSDGSSMEFTPQNGTYAACGLTTPAAGDYVFSLTCDGNGALKLGVTYPAAEGDYRVVYHDNATWTPENGVHNSSWIHPSRVISHKDGAEDIVSFYVNKEAGITPTMKFQTISGIDGSNVTWTDVSGGGINLSTIPQTGVYNFYLKQTNGSISVVNIEPYTGYYYIRVDCAGNTKWYDYRMVDHQMTYSEYAANISHDDATMDFTHYFMKFVNISTDDGKYKNVKFCIANDYSPCISDTLTRQSGDETPNHVNTNGELQANANIRFMWDNRNNSLKRAYLAEGKDEGSEFLVLRGQANELFDENGIALQNSKEEGQAGYNHKAPDNSVQFVDDENWIYETTVQVVPGSFVKLYAHFNNHDFYFKGADNETFNASNAIKLIDGSTGGAQKVRVIYDFKTDRLVCAMLPSGNVTVATPINADVMFIREHQGDIDQLTFSSEGNLSSIKTAYGVMRFDKWTLNNKDKSTHSPLGAPLSIYERSLYFVSFPFRVNLEEVFGFGQYGVHWIVQRYRGDLRAEKGFWAESGSFWEFIWDRRGVILEPYEGYLLTLDMDQLGESSSVWANDNERAELFFPSYGTMPTISSANVVYNIPAHKCTIDRTNEGLPDTGDPRTSYNRTVYDSHWNVIGVPTYVNTTGSTFAQTTWTANDSCPNFLYTWNADDNTLTAVDGEGYNYHAMNAYIVQYHGTITWAANSGSPYSIVARKTYSGKPKKITLRLELQQGDKVLDQTFVKMSEDEEVSADFQFGEDLCKEFYDKPAIYTKIDYLAVAGNTMPMSDQVTKIPVGVSRITAGEYTFSIPEGTEGIGVVLVDKETNTRTNLGLTDYSVYLTEGTDETRFEIEISPVSQVATDLTPIVSQGEGEKVRKVLIDGALYIVRDGKAYDAQGKLIQ